MPVCNAERTIGHAVKSILLQAYENGEAFVIDGRSTDRTLGILSRVSRNPHLFGFRVARSNVLRGQLTLTLQKSVQTTPWSYGIAFTSII